MSIWDDLDKEASVDDRIGNHDFTVDKVTQGAWEDGRPYYELDGRIVTANNFNLRQRFSPAPSEEDVAANLKMWDQRMKRSANLAHQNDVVLQAEYGVSLEQIKSGDSFRVLTDYRKGKDGKQYVEIRRF